MNRTLDLHRRARSGSHLATVAVAQDASARTVQYHSQDIVPIRAKLKYTTLIQVPPTEKIMEAATGDKDFWVVDVVGNFCFVHPAKAGISSNLNLITDKGNIYSFTLQDVSGSIREPPDLKVLIQPADQSSIVASTGPPQYVPAAQLEQSKQQLAAFSPTSARRSMSTRARTPCSSSSITTSKRTRRPSISSRSITTTSSPTSRPMRPEKFSVYEMKDGKPNLITYDLREGTYIIPKVMDSGYVELGKKKMEFTRKG